MGAMNRLFAFLAKWEEVVKVASGGEGDDEVFLVLRSDDRDDWPSTVLELLADFHGLKVDECAIREGGQLRLWWDDTSE